jgi:hypothetical protein
MTDPVSFTVRAQADPQTLPRLINFVAQRGLVPVAVRAREEGGVMTVVIEQRGLDDEQASIVAERMHVSVLVDGVSLARGRRLIKELP